MTTATALRRADALTLQALATELTRRQETKVDLTVDTRRIGFISDAPGLSLVTVDGAEEICPWNADGDGAQVQGWKVNEHAHGQVADRLGIPKRYYDRLRQEAPGLLDTNVRHWLSDKGETRMLRMLDGNVRAFLSDRYRRLDDFDLMETLIPIFAEIPGLTFQVASLTDTRLHVRALLPTIEREIKVGDVVQAGIEIKNSEVGAGALTIAPFVWRLVCLNGMVMPTAKRQHHVGRRVDQDDPNLGMYREATLDLDDAAFFAKTGDIVRATLTEERFDEIVAQLRSTVTGEKIVAPVAATQVLQQKFSLGDGERDSILASLAEGGDMSRWGMVNAITDAAKTAAGWDRLAEMEALGGEVATMKESDWEKIAVAVA